MGLRSAAGYIFVIGFLKGKLKFLFKFRDRPAAKISICTMKYFHVTEQPILP